MKGKRSIGISNTKKEHLTLELSSESHKETEGVSCLHVTSTTTVPSFRYFSQVDKFVMTPRRSTNCFEQTPDDRILMNLRIYIKLMTLIHRGLLATIGHVSHTCENRSKNTASRAGLRAPIGCHSRIRSGE